MREIFPLVFLFFFFILFYLFVCSFVFVFICFSLKGEQARAVAADTYRQTAHNNDDIKEKKSKTIERKECERWWWSTFKMQKPGVSQQVSTLTLSAALSLSNLWQDLTWRLRTVIQLQCRFSFRIGFNPICYAYSLFIMLGDLLCVQGDPQVFSFRKPLCVCVSEAAKGFHPQIWLLWGLQLVILFYYWLISSANCLVYKMWIHSGKKCSSQFPRGQRWTQRHSI